MKETPIYISRMKRHYQYEQEIPLIFKTDYYARSCNSRELAKTVIGRPDGEYVFLYDEDRKKIQFDEPHHPFDCRMDIATCPLTEISSGEAGEKTIDSVVTSMPGLALADPSLRGTNLSWNKLAHTARQLASPLGITGEWDEKALQKPDLSWQQAHIEYAMFEKLSPGNDFIPVKDENGNIRNLFSILELEGKNAIIPVSFAQNPNYIQPLTCYFSFSASWNFLNTEYLKKYPLAEIVITNELSVVLGNRPTEKRIVLGYFFGKGMIPFLFLKMLYKRKVSLLYMNTCNNTRNRENLTEILALLSRFTEMGMKVKLLKSTAEKGSFLNKNDTFLPLKGNIYLEEEVYAPPLPVSKETLILEGMNRDIIIPDNIRLETFGKIRTSAGKWMIEGLLTSGRKTVFMLHESIDLLSFSTIIVNAICYEKELFIGKWAIQTELTPVIFLPSSQSMDFEDKSGSSLPMYDLDFPQDKVKIEHRLNAIYREENCNMLIILLPREHLLKQVALETISFWGHSRKCGILFLCSTNEKIPASRKYTLKRIKSETISYAVEEDSPFWPNPEKFKILLKNGKWHAEELSESERNELAMTAAVTDYSMPEKLIENPLEIELRNKI